MSLRMPMWLTAGPLAIVLLMGAAPPGDRDLLDAARRGDVSAVRALLEGGADPNAAQGDGLSALHLAAEAGSVQIVELLLEHEASVDPKTQIGAYTPLHLASERGRTDVVRALLAAGADPAAVTTTTGVTPLHLAAKALGGEGAVRALLERGVPVDARESSAGQTPLMFAASSGRTASVRLLLSHGADPAIRATVIDVPRRMAVDRAARRRLQEALEELRARDGADAGSGWTPSPKEAQEAIRAQREFLGSEEAIREVLEDFTRDDLATRQPSWNTPSGYESDVEIVSWPMYEMLVGASGGMTALLHAAREGHIETVEALLDGGADIDQVSADGSSPLLIALQNGRYDLAMELIGRGANPSLATSTDGVTPLFAVLENQWAYNFTDTPHPHAQERQQAGYMDVLNALLEAGAEPNARLKSHLWYSDYLRGKMGINFTGATPFWRAAFAQDLEAMRALVAHGADPELPTAWPEPGMREGRQQDGRLQEDSGLPILPEGTPNMYPIHAAAGGGYMGLGAFMVSNVPNNFLNAVKYLVEEHGADVNWRDSWGYTPLHYASVRGDNVLIEYLVSKGADVKAISRLGQSTADMARGGRAGYFSRSPFPETVELLQSLGSELRCLNTHFRGTGDFCPGSGAAPFEHIEADEERAVR